MINRTLNITAPKNTDHITTATICTERVTLPRADEATRDEFSTFISNAVWNAGWSLAALKGKAREYKGGYYRTSQRNLARYIAVTGREVGFAYDKQKGGTKRPWTRGEDGAPVWLD